MTNSQNYVMIHFTNYEIEGIYETKISKGFSRIR